MASAPYEVVNPYAWPWTDEVLSAGDAVRCLRSRLWPPPSSRQVYRLWACGSLSDTMPNSLTMQMILLHWQQDARLRDQAPHAADARWHPPAFVSPIDLTWPGLFTVPPPCDPRF